MPKYAVEIIPKAEKEFLKLPERLKDSISRKILPSKIIPGPSDPKS
jgi:mRNA-degrading endonuclease RelE of RelBE toxin-antitoxin system